MIQKGRDTARQGSSTAQKEKERRTIENSLKKTRHQSINNLITFTLKNLKHILNAQMDTYFMVFVLS